MDKRKQEHLCEVCSEPLFNKNPSAKYCNECRDKIRDKRLSKKFIPSKTVESDNEYRLRGELELRDEFDVKKENRNINLVKLKHGLQKELIVLIAEEAHKRHLERMEFLIYRDNGILTKETEKELENNTQLRNKVLGIEDNSQENKDIKLIEESSIIDESLHKGGVYELQKEK